MTPNDTSVSYELRYAQNVIKDTYGENVSVTEKKKGLTKFGRNPDVGTAGYFTLWATGADQSNETYVADNVNSIDTISCSVANSQVVRIEGHTMTGGERTFVVQTATLNGTTKVTLTTPLNRVTRVAHNDASAVDLTGVTYVYEDTAITAGKPTDTTKIHITVPLGFNQSQKAATAISKDDYYIITRFSAGYLEKTGSNTAEVQLEVRAAGGVWKPIAEPIVIMTGNESTRLFNPYKIVPKNSEIRLVAQASATGQTITGDFEGYLASRV